MQLSIAALLLVIALGCSAPAPGSESPRTDARPTELNPYGAPYPTANRGTAARAGAQAGAVMSNYKFQGYRVSEPGTAIEPGALAPVSLADYFDPELRNKAASGAPYRVLHIQVSFMWCTPCVEETRSMVSIAKSASAKGVLFLTAVADGPIQGKAAELPEFDAWILRHKANYTHVLDPAVRSFGNFFDPNTGSFNADVDLRSMEILYAGSGKLPDIDAHVTKWAQWAEANPARGSQ